MKHANCPNCNRPLHPVTYPGGSMLNEDQWASQRAGDWYCDRCPPNSRSRRNDRRYYWSHELAITTTPDRLPNFIERVRGIATNAGILAEGPWTDSCARALAAALIAEVAKSDPPLGATISERTTAKPLNFRRTATDRT